MINSPLILPCGLVLKNRIAKSAMSENMSTKSNCPDVEFERLYHRWSAGGSGLLITGNVMCDHRALGEPNNVIIEKDHACETGLRAWAKAGTENNTKLFMQINHPGKQSPKFLSEVPVAPSAIGFKSSMKALFNKPRALTEEEIIEIINRFSYTASRAKSAGFSGVQIHGAHGYLLSQFLSPIHNQRKDQWGGGLENRMRFARETYRAIRSEVGKDFPISIKLNSADFQKGGFTEVESMEVVKTLADDGLDLIEISGGSYEAPVMTGAKAKKSTVKREAYFLEYVEKVRKLTKVPLMLTGGFRTENAMTEALNSGALDLIGLARSVAIDPDFPIKILNQTNAKSKVKQLSTGIKALDKNIPLEIVWYTAQLHRMGKGKNPNPNASPILAAFRTMAELGINSIKRTRSL